MAGFIIVNDQLAVAAFCSVAEIPERCSLGCVQGIHFLIAYLAMSLTKTGGFRKFILWTTANFE
jgi:hypothetical protein